MAANEDFCLVRMFMKFEEYLIFDWYMVFLRNFFSIPTQARIAGNILHTVCFWKEGWNDITDSVVCMLLSVKRSWSDHV